ncbi:nucleotidyl transferase AbiEii/AbiGii toxin family protein [Pedobacter sp. SD-b]|uniref:Nucleotidyl transferase AbiEii/AbiGii toxin family protein n=1 Tax=Pedobacter segetis TaxID=2793069 RepID=A0ABS1BL73_9SPHI|nr:nucleotidyl transferase AbiEii/AbiGii toxin family protein [Pedobacter segetis]MBK0383638.1 nucleotidyl transferase AbiEii/AbiGii toxin family protein [Pedobacter segetis]
MLHWETVNDLLKESLQLLMQTEELKDFRLVGGTALSLHLGHRMSIDIDLFTDAPYQSVDFDAIENLLMASFMYVSGDFGGNPGMGKTYLIGNDKDNVVKLDLFYSMDSFFQEPVMEDGIRLATLEEIIAMKVDVVQRGGRKKDFWDLHEILENYQVNNMISLHFQRFEWTHDESAIRKNFTDFSKADNDPDPICLRGKHWGFIKEDIEEAVNLE